MNFIFIYSIIILAIISRFVPHLANAAPVTALAIFAAVYLPKKQAIGITLVVRFVSDLFLGFFAWPLLVAVYASHLFGILLGLWIKNSKENSANFWLKIFSSGITSSLVFFLTTNFAFLYKSYPHSWAGIMQSYINGLPFLRGTLVGDIGYTVALFALFALAVKLKENLKPKPIETAT